MKLFEDILKFFTGRPTSEEKATVETDSATEKN